jgi:alpha-tubulin suppressor-like RCC1 family protein
MTFNVSCGSPGSAALLRGLALLLLLVKAVTAQNAGVTKVACGNEQTAFVKSDGSLWGMGLNTAGELADGTTNRVTTPKKIISGNLAAVACGGSDFSLGLTTGGSLYGAGNNYHGQLGDGTTNNHSSAVLIVSSGVAAIACGGGHSLFAKSDGSL